MTLAKPKTSLAAGFSWLRPTRSHPLARFVGIDIGVDRASIVALGSRSRDQRRATHRNHHPLRWLARHQLAIPVDPLAAPRSDWLEQVTGALVDRLPRSIDGEQAVVALSLPLPWMHYQVVPGTEIETSKRQCDAMFASSLFQSPSHMGYWPLSDDASGPNDPVVIVAVADSAAYDVADAVSSLGYQIESVQPHGAALVKAAQAMTGIDPQCIVMLNRTGGMIAIKNARSVGLCRVLPAIPDTVLSAGVANGLTLDAIRPWLADIAAEIISTRSFASRVQSLDRSKPILLCGDVASIEDLDSVLATLTETPVALWHYAGKARPSEFDPGQPGSADLRSFDTSRMKPDTDYAVALSLAYSAAQSIAGNIAK